MDPKNSLSSVINNCNESTFKKKNIKNCNKNLGKFTFKAKHCENNSWVDECCCNEIKDVCFSDCEVIKKECMEVCPKCNGRLLNLQVKLKNICPNRLIVVGVLIYENNKLYAFKVKKLHTGFFNCNCKDFNAGEFCFIFKENDLCENRRFTAKVIHHYVRF